MDAVLMHQQCWEQRLAVHAEGTDTLTCSVNSAQWFLGIQDGHDS